MKAQTKSVLSRLSTARRWLELFEAEYPEDGQEQSEQDSFATDLLISFTKRYRRELIHQSGLADRFENDFDRYLNAKEAAGEADRVLEYAKSLEGSETPSCDAQALVQWLFESVLALVIRANLLEQDNPRLPRMRTEYQQFCDAENIQV